MSKEKETKDMLRDMLNRAKTEENKEKLINEIYNITKEAHKEGWDSCEKDLRENISVENVGGQIIVNIGSKINKK
jgi:uncharacterized protein (UPF0335 family)